MESFKVLEKATHQSPGPFLCRVLHHSVLAEKPLHAQPSRETHLPQVTVISMCLRDYC